MFGVACLVREALATRLKQRLTKIEKGEMKRRGFDEVKWEMELIETNAERCQKKVLKNITNPLK